MTMPVGSVIAGYTIERTLGAGGMGTVYLARHPTLPRSDALKVLSAELSSDPQFRARFRREADLAASLDHPNIVRVYTRGETDDGRLWIAMQFVDGTDAGKALDDGPLPVERTVHILNEVAKALDFAHSRGLLHRDIKPANFLLAGPPGPYERVLLADFGIARAVDDASKLTATGSMMTTVAYASPESVEGKQLDHRSDLYSLGCALFRMLTNRTPYQGAGAMSAVLMAHIMRPPPRATEFAPWLPPAIDDVLATVMAKDPNARYQNAREFAAAAAAALTGSQAPAPQNESFTGAPIPPAGNTGNTQIRPDSWMREPTQTYPSGYFSGAQQLPVKPSSKRRWWLIGAAAAVVAAVVAGVVLMLPRGEDLGPYATRSFNHSFGSTKLDQRPTDFATLTLADADAALSLGAQPKALVAPDGEIPSWLKDLVDGSPTVLNSADPAAVREAGPKLILDTGPALTEQGYDTLAEIAPTITRPTGGQEFGPQERLTWLGDILGRQARARELKQELSNAQAKVIGGHSAFKGKSISVFLFSNSGLSAALSGSPAASYLSGIGFDYSPDLNTGADGKSETPIQPETLWNYKSDVSLVLRSDKAAGNGGFSGLPSQFDTHGGTIIVIDDPSMLSAFASGGPAATGYLNEHAVELLAARVK